MSKLKGMSQQPKVPSVPPPPRSEDRSHVGESEGSSFSDVLEGSSESSTTDSSVSSDGGSGGQGGQQGGHQQGEGQNHREGQVYLSDEEMVIHEVDLKQKEALQQERILTFFQTPVFRPTNQSVVGNLMFDVKNHTLPAMMLDRIVSEVQLAQGVTGGVGFHFDLKGDVLGGMQLQIKFEGGKVHAEFITNVAEIHRMMSGQLDELRKQLMQRGLNVGRLEVRDPNEKRREQQREQHKKDRERQQKKQEERNETLREGEGEELAPST